MGETSERHNRSALRQIDRLADAATTDFFLQCWDQLLVAEMREIVRLALVGAQAEARPPQAMDTLSTETGEKANG